MNEKEYNTLIEIVLNYNGAFARIETTAGLVEKLETRPGERDATNQPALYSGIECIPLGDRLLD